MEAHLTSGHEKLATSDGGLHGQQSSELDQTAVEQGIKSNVVDWNGPDDPQNPRNWPAWKRMAQVVFASAFLLNA